MSAEPARSVTATWLYTLASIVFFYGFFDLIVALAIFESYLDTLEPLALTALVLQLVATATQLRYCWFLRVGRGGGLPRNAWTVALVAPAALVWIVGLAAPGPALPTAVPLWAAATLIAPLLPRPRRWTLLLIGLLATIGQVALAGWLQGTSATRPAEGSSDWMIAFFAFLLPFMSLTSLWWWEVVVRLDRTRRTAAELAVTQERLRFASDLHDIQGHHLQVISLKSELAERLLERDPARARELVHETRQIAKEALEETRSLVAGYRQVAFDDELENAREVLAAAGADCTLRLGPVPPDAASQRALGSVMREATTNILRHSEATTVTIEFAAKGAGYELRITNDGVTDRTAATAGRADGSGLAGLRERLAAIGGALDTSLDASTGVFRLVAAAPVASEANA
ncbi:sensor histidine kinase [Agromyces larvae]|uniref:Histidine kinase n=1 Tax=Agromyces larvae TaxID=2929802 RepID=A0ABY4C1N2_9MICO|nr:histidine kinase [Agromyces larvae]UOE45244.1 histidine kinase [Agromyces larvae]